MPCDSVNVPRCSLLQEAASSCDFPSSGLLLEMVPLLKPYDGSAPELSDTLGPHHMLLGHRYHPDCIHGSSVLFMGQVS